jgi:hypothetical protein
MEEADGGGGARGGGGGGEAIAEGRPAAAAGSGSGGGWRDITEVGLCGLGGPDPWGKRDEVPSWFAWEVVLSLLLSRSSSPRI